MKNIFTLFAVGIIALMAIGCDKTEPAEQQGSLNTPEFSANANDNSITVSWTVVEGAAYYEIWLNNDEPTKTDKTVHRFDGLKWNTEYTVNLKAVGTDGSGSKVASQKVTIAVR
ncbi:MAG: hypothetical protein UHS52_03175, partial [Alistipes sp.]|nr:hypothetical protein [Alistipes sp.]